MMGERRVMQEALFYGFSLERHVPSDHLLRKIDRFVDLSGLRAHLERSEVRLNSEGFSNQACSDLTCWLDGG